MKMASATDVLLVGLLLFIYLSKAVHCGEPCAPNDYNSYKARQGFESRCLKRESEPLKFPTTYF